MLLVYTLCMPTRVHFQTPDNYSVIMGFYQNTIAVRGVCKVILPGLRRLCKSKRVSVHGVVWRGVAPERLPNRNALYDAVLQYKPISDDLDRTYMAFFLRAGGETMLVYALIEKANGLRPK